MEPVVPSDTASTPKNKSLCETLEVNWMMSTLNKIVMPLTKDLSFDAHCVDPGAGASLMWTVPTRLDQTKLSASGSSNTQRTCGKRQSHSSDEERAWKGDRKRNGDDWSWAWSEEEKTSEWTGSMEENPPYSR